MRDESRGFDAVSESVRAARVFVAATVDEWGLGDLEWPLVQIVSELACNAVIHARTPFTVTLAQTDAGCRLGVTDSSPRRIQPRRYDAEATTGRGLQLVEQMSRSWGVESTDESKTVWVEVEAAPLIEHDVDVDVDALLDEFMLDGEDDIAPAPSRLAGDETSGGSADVTARAVELVGV